MPKEFLKIFQFLEQVDRQIQILGNGGLMNFWRYPPQSNFCSQIWHRVVCYKACDTFYWANFTGHIFLALQMMFRNGFSQGVRRIAEITGSAIGCRKVEILTPRFSHGCLVQQYLPVNGFKLIDVSPRMAPYA